MGSWHLNISFYSEALSGGLVRGVPKESQSFATAIKIYPKTSALIFRTIMSQLKQEVVLCKFSDTKHSYTGKYLCLQAWTLEAGEE